MITQRALDAIKQQVVRDLAGEWYNCPDPIMDAGEFDDLEVDGTNDGVIELSVKKNGVKSKLAVTISVTQLGG